EIFLFFAQFSMRPLHFYPEWYWLPLAESRIAVANPRQRQNIRRSFGVAPHPAPIAPRVHAIARDSELLQGFPDVQTNLRLSHSNSKKIPASHLWLRRHSAHST